MSEEPRYDEIGYWSEIKLDIIREYAQPYSTIFTKKGFHHVYIDAFAGAGKHIAKSTGEFVAGSPTNALHVKPPFDEYYFIDLDNLRVKALQDMAAAREDVQVLEGDCNELLLSHVFPNVQYKQFRRGLCILDPYKLNLKWDVIHTAGQMESIEIFLNFPVMDMNRNVLWRNPERVSPERADRLTAFWGDESWREAAYSTYRNLFGYEEKEGNDAVAKAFQERLRTAAGFGYVPAPIPMRNTTGATVYYLFFAAQKPEAAKIVTDIFNKYREYGSR